MYQRKNFAYGKVATAPSPAASGTTLVLETGQGARFPNTSGGTYPCVVKQTNLPATPDNAEVVLVTSHDPANDNFTITRTQEGSGARTIEVGDEFYLSPTDGVWDQIDVLTTKGDLLGFDTAYTRIPVGTDNQVLTADSSDSQGIAWKDVGAVSNVRNEVPTGTINGTNTDFTIAASPVTGTLRVYVNGVRQKVTDDYTLSGTTITFVVAPLTDSKILVDYETNAGTYATGSADFINNETPSGTVNGSNTSFTLANTPVAGTLHLLRDGQEIYETNDYTISGATITMVAAPVTGSVLRANYQRSLSVAGNADTLDGQHAPSGTIVGTTDTQELSNKTLVSPLFKGTVDGWVSANETWTYASATTITVPSGAASKYSVGDRIRWKQGGGYKYGVLTVVADTLLTILINTDYTVANSAITDNYYSHEETPVGYPTSGFAYTPTISTTANCGTFSNTKVNIVGGLLFARGRITYANALTSGNLTITLPTTLPFGVGLHSIGFAHYFNSGVADITCLVIPISTTTLIFYYSDQSSGLTGTSVNSANWSSGDYVDWIISYPCF